MHFRIRSDGNVHILELSGSFDAQHASQARQWLDQALSNKPPNVVVDLREVSFLDSTGLATLVQGMKRSRMENGDLRLCGLQQPVRMIFELTRLDRVFEIFPSQEEAVLAFSDT
jgi:anti-sigma B factor antagonist